jgi:hypothetical protein
MPDKDYAKFLKEDYKKNKGIEDGYYSSMLKYNYRQE